MSFEAKVAELGLDLPAAATAGAGLYVPAVLSGNLLYVSGQVPLKDGAPMAKGHLGREIDIDTGAALARQCAIQGLGIARSYLGSLDRVTRVIRLGGFVASAPGFIDHPRVVNGASQLMIDVFGDAGRHARCAVGMAELPLGVPVEVEFLFEVAPA